MSRFKPNGHYYFENIQKLPTDKEVFHIPPYGYLTQIRIEPNLPLANMDAGRSFRLEVLLTDFSGKKIPISVQMMCESVA